MSRDNGGIRRIGIAGYMGAGKSTCAEIVAAAQRAGARIIDADSEAKALMNSDRSIRRRLVETFGESAAGGSAVVFQNLAKVVFASARSMGTLNGIVHPALVKVLHERVFAEERGCILDAALIPMWNIEEWFDVCIWITAAAPLRIERIQKKTALTPEQIAARMAVQEEMLRPPRGRRWLHFSNDGPLDGLQNRIFELLDEARKTYF